METPLSERMAQRLRRWLVVVLALMLGWWIVWPRPAIGLEVAAKGPESVEERGATLFAQHCAGCHVNGGNVIRRGKTLQLAALRRAGLEGPEAVARVAALGQGQMGGYGQVLGPGGAEAVGGWVWSQALAGWPKAEQKITKVQGSFLISPQPSP
jgi:cytochrome c6